MIKVAAVQMTSSEDKKQNLEKAEKFVIEAAEQDCQLVVFPELFNCMTRKKLIPQEAEDLTGETVCALQKLSKQYNVYIAGSIFFKGPSLPYNMALLCSNKGQIILKYAKIHLFDVDIPGQVTHKESERIAPGDRIALVKTDIGVIGMSVCYDLRFPQMFSALRNAGSDIVLLPSAFTFATGRYHWEVLVRARAIENQVFVVAPNQYGKLPNGINTYGHTLICDPWGDILIQKKEGEGIVVAPLNFSRLKTIRTEMPVWDHKRPFNEKCD